LKDKSAGTDSNGHPSDPIDETIVSAPVVARPAGVPATVGPYSVLQKLGQGGMGAVYLAEDPKLRRSIAIKVLPDELAAHREWMERFEKEAQLLASINHPNIATIYSLEEDGGTKFLTLELISGPDLSAKLIDTRTLDRGAGFVRRPARKSP